MPALVVSVLAACATPPPDPTPRPPDSAPVCERPTLPSRDGCAVTDDCPGPLDECVERLCVSDHGEHVLSPEEAVSGVVWPDGDVDRYTLEVPEAPARYTFSTVSSTDRNAELAFTWVAPDGAPYLGLLEPTEVDLLLPTAGTWTLEVRDAGQGGDEDFTYGLVLCPDVTPDPPVATIAVGAALVVQTLSFAADGEQRVGLQVDAEGVLVVDAGPARVTLRSDAGDLLARCESCRLAYPFAEVRAYTLDVRALAPTEVDMSVWVEPFDGVTAQEPDGDVASANPTGARIRGHLDAVWDIDVFDVLEPGSWEVDVECDAYSGALARVEVEVGDEGGAWSLHDEPADDVHISGVGPGAGAWYDCTFEAYLPSDDDDTTTD